MSMTEEELEIKKAFVLKALENHADAIEKTARENKGYFIGEMSGIEFNPDDNYHRGHGKPYFRFPRFRRNRCNGNSDPFRIDVSIVYDFPDEIPQR